MTHSSPENAEMSLIEAGDDLYSAFCGYGKTKGQIEALTNYANASNAYRGGVIRAQRVTVSELDALASVAKILEATEERDVEWLLDLLSTAKTGDHRKADVRLFRRQLSQVAASEMYSTLTSPDVPAQQMPDRDAIARAIYGVATDWLKHFFR